LPRAECFNFFLDLRPFLCGLIYTLARFSMYRNNVYTSLFCVYLPRGASKRLEGDLAFRERMHVFTCRDI
jgi:hypothetical protein